MQADVIEELPIKVHNSHLVHGFLYDLREQRALSCEFDRLNVSVSNVLEKNLDTLSRLIDDYGQEQGRFQYYQRQVVRQNNTRAAHIAAVVFFLLFLFFNFVSFSVCRFNSLPYQKSENEARVNAGKDPLPEEDLSKNFKPIAKPSRLETIMASKQIARQCQQINSTATQTFEKLYVVDALQKAK